VALIAPDLRLLGSENGLTLVRRAGTLCRAGREMGGRLIGRYRAAPVAGRESSPPLGMQQLLLTGRPRPPGPPHGRLTLWWAVLGAAALPLAGSSGSRDFDGRKRVGNTPSSGLRNVQRALAGRSPRGGRLPPPLLLSPAHPLASFPLPPSYTHRTRSALGVARCRSVPVPTRVPITAAHQGYPPAPASAACRRREHCARDTRLVPPAGQEAPAANQGPAFPGGWWEAWKVRPFGGWR